MAFPSTGRGGPTGGATLRQVRAALEKGWKPGLTVLTGEDLYHLDAAQKALLEHLAPQAAGGFGLTVFGDGKLDPGEVVASARAVSMFAARRVVFVREVAILLGEPDSLVEYAKNPPAGSFLLVRAPKLDLRRPLHKALATVGTRLEFAQASPGSELVEEIRALAKERGVALDRSVAEFLLDSCGADLLRVASEVDKISAWLGGAKTPVTLEIARAVGVGGGSLDGWEVSNAIVRGDPQAAHAALRRLLASGVEPLQLLGGLSWRVRTLLQAKGMAASGVSSFDISNSIRMPRKDLEPFLRAVTRLSPEELLTFPSKLLAADRALKSRGLDSRAVMDTLVRGLTGSPAEAP